MVSKFHLKTQTKEGEEKTESKESSERIRGSPVRAPKQPFGALQP